MHERHFGSDVLRGCLWMIGKAVIVVVAIAGPPLLGPSPVSQPVPWLDAGDVALVSSAAATESVVTPATASGDEPR